MRSVMVTRLLDALAFPLAYQWPFRLWILPSVLAEDDAVALAGLPLEAPNAVEHLGRREVNNAVRVFADEANRRRFPVLAALAEGFRTPEVVAAAEAMCGIDLTGCLLRIEYAMDTDGFWLEPHVDIPVKRMTLLLYLTEGDEGPSLGTDIHDGDLTLVKSVRADFNSALVFVPGSDTWHSFRRRPIAGIRRSLIVNYVTPDWRARHELAFERPVK